MAPLKRFDPRQIERSPPARRLAGPASSHGPDDRAPRSINLETFQPPHARQAAAGRAERHG
ncbi:hypothetical protein HMPREF0185_00290 [Brevundimonas diminuta 470-4]|nr:hypothetical protein HMPREF0185_00290 [Brevundimonas diminuta 470-4]